MYSYTVQTYSALAAVPSFFHTKSQAQAYFNRVRPMADEDEVVLLQGSFTPLTQGKETVGYRSYGRVFELARK